MKLEAHEILSKPAFNEKSTTMQNEDNKYTFVIHHKANKQQVVAAVIKLFKVTPVKVNIINLPRKPKKKDRFTEGYTNFRKKAIVTLKSGDKIKDMIVE